MSSAARIPSSYEEVLAELAVLIDSEQLRHIMKYQVHGK